MFFDGQRQHQLADPEQDVGLAEVELDGASVELERPGVEERPLARLCPGGKTLEDLKTDKTGACYCNKNLMGRVNNLKCIGCPAEVLVVE